MRKKAIDKHLDIIWFALEGYQEGCIPFRDEDDLDEDSEYLETNREYAAEWKQLVRSFKWIEKRLRALDQNSPE